MNKILVIDDDVEINDLMAKVLVRAGHEVRTATTGEAALGLLDSFPADVVIVDKNLSQMHGGEVVVQVRLRLPFAAVILITTFHEPFALGPERLDGYLSKPFKSLKVIEEAVGAALESAAQLRRREELKVRLSQVVAELTPGQKKRP